MNSTAAQRWSQHLQQWAIPPQITAAATRSPWGFPVARFAERTDEALRNPQGESYVEARRWIGRSGSVLDVGAGVGYASLPLAPPATALTAIDSAPGMLEAYAERASGRRISARTIAGRWPESADLAGAHDVVVLSHVLYDVQDIAPFISALTSSARRRVVIEQPIRHPLTWMAPLWLRFHGISRPTTPVLSDLLEVLNESQVSDLTVTRWSRSDGFGESDSRRVATVTRRLCLEPNREQEVAQALAELDAAQSGPNAGLDVATLSWAGEA